MQVLASPFLTLAGSPGSFLYSGETGADLATDGLVPAVVGKDH